MATKFKGAEQDLAGKIADWVNSNKLEDVSMCYSQYEHDLIIGGYQKLKPKKENKKKNDN